MKTLELGDSPNAPGRQLPMKGLQLNLLGGFELRADVGAIPAPAKKVRGLIAYLAMTGPRLQARETLASLLWPDSSDAQARMSLRNALATLRLTLGNNHRLVVSDNENVGLDYGLLSTDVWSMETRAAESSIDALRAAFRLYGGDFLLGLRLDVSAFEQWRETERTRLHALAVNTGTRLLAALHSQHGLEEALSVGNRLLALDPLREDVHRTMMRVHTEQGHPALALRQYQLCRAALAQELGVSPELETERLHNSLLQRRRSEIFPAERQSRGESAGQSPIASVGDHEYESQPSFSSDLRSEANDSDRAATPNSTLSAAAAPVFVGRREILRHLLGLLDISTTAKAGHTALVRGEAGIGKTRLATKLAELSHKRHIVSHVVRLLDFGGEAYRDPLAQLTQSLFGLSKEAPVARRAEAVEHAVRFGVIGLSQRIFAYMLLDVPQPTHLKAAFEAMDLTARAQGKLAVIVSLLVHSSSRGGLLIIIDDIHWAPPDAVGELASLALAVKSQPALLLLTSRPENDPIDASWRSAIRGVHFSSMELPPLSVAEAHEMAAHYGHKATASLEACIQRAEGNPLFLDQLLRAAEGAAVPNSVQSLVLTQVDRFPALVREALQAASVIGQKFAPALVEHLTGGRLSSLEDLLRSTLVIRDGMELRFAHALIQEAVYASIIRSRKVQLHLRLAEWFAGRDAERQAEHLDAAGSDRAAATYLEAAERFRDKGNPRTALRLAERAAQIAPDAALGERLALLRAHLLLELGDTQPALDEYRRALAQASVDIHKRRALKGIAAALRVLDRHQEALSTLDQAMHYAAPSDEGEATEEWLLRGNLHFPLGESAQCIAAHQRAYAHAVRAASPRLEAEALGCIGDAHYVAGRYLSAHEHYEGCVNHARRHGLIGVQAAYQSMLALTHFYRLEFTETRDAVSEAIELARSANLMRHEAVAYTVLSEFKIAIGEFEGGRRDAETLVDLARRIGARRFESDGLEQWGLALYYLGEKRRAVRLLKESLDLIGTIGETYNGPWVLAVAGLISQSAKVRRAYLERGEALLQKPCVAHNHMYFFRFGIEVALDMHDWARAQRYADSLELFMHQQPTPWSDYHVRQGRVLSQLGRGSEDEKTIEALRMLRGQAEPTRDGGLVERCKLAKLTASRACPPSSCYASPVLVKKLSVNNLAACVTRLGISGPMRR